MVPSILFNSVLLLAVSIPSLAQTSDTTGGNCTIFDWDHKAPYLREYPPMRVSGAKTCPQQNDKNSNMTCALTASGDELFPALKNVTGLHNGYWPSMVEAAVDKASYLAPAFNDSVIVSIDQTRILQPGQSGYLNLTALMFCYTGALSNCTGALENGTGVEFCAPVWQHKYIISGRWQVVNISKDEVSKYPDPYANEVKDPGESAAPRLEQAGWMVVLGITLGTILL
ncbi:uncharacterized protein ACLA_087640 [Aspergillus clavatus NRRL 1]|uniref:Uncharacterized protein n=1 Tax=Aspergillus clavatus (strain ATCC 1007 / CBS 513.65 / DSM 816 / NCTC 3887 / NRRL 1 / QM 1276 / 107) TaxID=344612 RepID=A1CUS1_ASPCL|nr:uncharacterized protein ACLA_087640 [Aspergillus clavatus NRRL 1]EAW07058.1 conserved hypothetical protein [Aspergillus clavatus NRRL 1]